MGRIAQLAGVVALTALSASISQVSHAADDLYDVLALALKNDPTLRQAEANYRANRENMIQSRANLLPSLNATGNTTRSTNGPSNEVRGVNLFTGQPQIQPAHSFRPGINNHGWGLNLGQSLVDLAQWYGFQSARAADKAAAVNLAAQEQDLIMRVSMAYFDVLRATDLLDTNIQEEEAALRSLEQTQQREEVGLVAITDVYDAQAAYDLARNTTIIQQDLLRSSYEALEAITGQPHPEIKTLDSEFPIVNADGALIEWENQAKDSSLAIAAAQFTLDSQEKNLKARRSDHLPTIALAGNFTHSVSDPLFQPGIGFAVGGGAFDRTSLALNLTIPLYNGGAVSSRRRAAEYNVIAAKESLEFTERQLTQNIRNAYRRVNTDVKVIDQRNQSILSAQTALEATELGAEVGTRNIVEVLRARENLYRALRDYADARYTYILDSLFLKQTAGILTPQDVIELNEWLAEG